MGKKKNLRGAKIAAGKLLSSAIAKIAEEKSEMVTIDGVDVIVSKAQAFARLVWKAALGYTDISCEGDGTTSIIHSPSLAHQQMIIERMEGKAAASEPIKKSQKNKLVDKITDEVAKRINDLDD